MLYVLLTLVNFFIGRFDLKKAYNFTIMIDSKLSKYNL